MFYSLNHPLKTSTVISTARKEVGGIEGVNQEEWEKVLLMLYWLGAKSSGLGVYQYQGKGFRDNRQDWECTSKGGKLTEHIALTHATIKLYYDGTTA